MDPKTAVQNPFHAGELEAQARAGVGDVSQWAGGFIRSYLPEQHREFHTSLPFLVIAGADSDERIWVTLLDGDEGFIHSPDAYSLTLNTIIDIQDPLADTLNTGTDVGALGIELATRRRNRFSGQFNKTADGYAIDIHQTFGNCPQYINERAWTRVPRNTPAQVKRSSTLSISQIELIKHADTMFIGSGHQKSNNTPSRSYDASHRGGAPGFVHVSDTSHLQIPDYAGNNFFNTIGNLISNPRIGLVFVNFETGSLLHISGRATIDWSPQNTFDSDALRVIDVEIDAVIERPGAVALRWSQQDHLLRQLKVARRKKEAHNITSFYLTPADHKPLPGFKAGQHLPVEIQIPGQTGTSKRSYSLSGPPDATNSYRLSIKREHKGLVSRFFHDQLYEGAIIRASVPSGDFVMPCGNCPVVLASAGVGLTPMISMLHSTLSDAVPRRIWFVHGSRNGNEHALQSEVTQLIAKHPYAQQKRFYSRPLESDILGKDYDKHGRITAQDVLNLNSGPDTQYLLCGPTPFLADIKNGLEASGVPAENIHYETFGPAG